MCTSGRQVTCCWSDFSRTSPRSTLAYVSVLSDSCGILIDMYHAVDRSAVVPAHSLHHWATLQTVSAVLFMVSVPRWPCSVFSLSINKETPKEYVKQTEPQATTMIELQHLIFPLLKCLGPYLHLDTILFFKVCRVLKNFFKKVRNRSAFDLLH